MSVLSVLSVHVDVAPNSEAQVSVCPLVLRSPHGHVGDGED